MPHGVCLEKLENTNKQKTYAPQTIFSNFRRGVGEESPYSLGRESKRGAFGYFGQAKYHPVGHYIKYLNVFEHKIENTLPGGSNACRDFSLRSKPLALLVSLARRVLCGTFVVLGTFATKSTTP